MGSPDQPRDARGRFSRTDGRTKQEQDNERYWGAKEREIQLGEAADRAAEKLNNHLLRRKRVHTDMDVVKFERTEARLEKAFYEATEAWRGARTELAHLPRPRKKRRR